MCRVLISQETGPGRSDLLWLRATCRLADSSSVIYTRQWTVYSAQSTVHILQCTLYRVHRTVHILQCTLYRVHRTVHSVNDQRIKYNVQKGAGEEGNKRSLVKYHNRF